jgi:Nineteen complex-related protein 2
MFVPKRSTLSKQVAESKGRKFGLQVYAYNHLLQILTSSAAHPSTSSPSTEPQTRTLYTKEYLAQLRDSTPSTPRDLSRYLSEDDSTDSGAAQAHARPAEILDEAVIRALKERRRDRARGEDYISLSSEKAPRAPSDDEETYASFVDDPVRLQKNMDAAQKQYKAEQIKEALYQSDSEEMSDVDANEWENQQIAKASGGAGVKVGRKRDLYGMPGEIPPVPTFAVALGGLTGMLDELRRKRDEGLRLADELDAESEALATRQEAVQESLAQAGRDYEALQDEFKATGANRGLDEVGEITVPLSR